MTETMTETEGTEAMDKKIWGAEDCDDGVVLSYAIERGDIVSHTALERLGASDVALLDERLKRHRNLRFYRVTDWSDRGWLVQRDPDAIVTEMRREAGAAGDTEMVDLCDAVAVGAAEVTDVLEYVGIHTTD